MPSSFIGPDCPFSFKASKIHCRVSSGENCAYNATRSRQRNSPLVSEEKNGPSNPRGPRPPTLPLLDSGPLIAALTVLVVGVADKFGGDDDDDFAQVQVGDEDACEDEECLILWVVEDDSLGSDKVVALDCG